MAVPENTFLWNAYQEIRRDRPVGMAPGRIPISAIAAWCDFHGVDCPVQRNRVKRAVMAMDDVEMAGLSQSSP